MPSKSLKVTFLLEVDSAEAAIAYLSSHYLSRNKRGCRVVQKQTDFNLANLCQALIRDWQGGKVAYGAGSITLTFSAGELTDAADFVVYSSSSGDRLLYSRPPTPVKMPEPGVAETPVPQESSTLQPIIAELARNLYVTQEALAQLIDHQRLVETRIDSLSQQQTTFEKKLTEHVSQTWSMSNKAAELQAQLFARQVETAVEAQFVEAHPQWQSALKEQAAFLSRQFQDVLKAQADAFSQQLKAALEAQGSLFAQMLTQQLASTSRHFTTRVDDVQTQLKALTVQLEALKQQQDAETVQPPQTEAEWRQRLEQTWGTVGDYEHYSFDYRIANAQTPLFVTPDWIALCELDWARKLSPTLALLYELIYVPDGIGDAGADILQQFGHHIDADTREPYYVYQRGGFTAYEALWQTVNDPQYSWLSDLEKLWAEVGDRPEIFQLFGWESAAIEALKRILRRARYHQSADGSAPSDSNNIMSEHLILLNIGPFTPITVEALKRAYRQAMKTAHPDAGGSTKQAQKVNEAYDAILKHYFPNAG